MNKTFWMALVVCVGIGGFYFGRNTNGPTKQINTETFSSLTTREPNSGSDEQVLNKIVYNTKTEKDVPLMIAKIQKFAADNPASDVAKIYAAMVTPMPLLKGIVYRLRMIVEPVDVAYLSILSSLRMFKRNNERRGPHIDALFDYFTNPNPDEVISGQKGLFTSGAQFQDYMATKVAPEVERQVAVLKEVAGRANMNQVLFMYDANLLFGLPNMLSDGPTIRFKKFMPGHLKAMIANMEMRMGFGYYLASYNIEDLPKFLNALTKETFAAKKSDFWRGLAASAFDLHIQSPKEFYQHLVGNGFGAKYPQLFVLREPAKDRGRQKGYLARSLEHLQAAVDYRTLAFNDMEVYERNANGREYFIDPDFATSRATISSAILQKRTRLLKGRETFTDRITGQGFELNIPAMFDYRNPAINDLKRLYANDFEPGDEKLGRDPKTFKWNYNYGKVRNWPDPSFGGVLPGTSSAAAYREKLVSISRDASLSPLTAWLRFFM